MKGLLIVLTSLILHHTIDAQDMRPYTDGALAYEDFKGENLDLDSLTGMIFFDYNFVEHSEVIDGISFPMNTMEVLVNQSQSWLNFDMIPDISIEYFQILFDIEYLYAQNYNALLINNPLEDKFNETRHLFEDKKIVLQKYKLESLNGSRPEINSKWKNKIEKEINEVKYEESLMELESDFGFDGHIGFGINILGSDLNEYYGNSFGLAMGMNFNLKYVYLVLSGSLGIGSVKKSHDEFPLWEEGLFRNDVIWNIGFGKRIKYKRFYISPFIGPSLINIYIDKQDHEDTYPETSDTKWKIGTGVLFDIPFVNKYSPVNTSNIYPNRSSNPINQNHGLRVSLHYVPKAKLFDRYSGSGLNIALSYYYHLGDLNIKN